MSTSIQNSTQNRRNSTVSTVKKSVAIAAFACDRMNSDHAGPDVPGVGSRPASRKIVQTVDAAILWPRRWSSPWIRR